MTPRTSRPGGSAAGPPGRAERARARGGPARPRDARVGGLRRLPAGQIVFDTEDTMSVPAYLLVPDGRRTSPRGRPSWPVTATGPASHRWWGSSTRHAQRRLRAAAGPPGLHRAGARPALLRRAARLEPRGSLRLRHQPRSCRHGGLEPAGAEHLGSAAIARCAGAAPARRPTPGHDRHLLRWHRHALHRRRRHPRGGSGGSGYFSSWAVSHTMPWNMCGSQIMYGMLGRLEHEDLGALVAPRPMLVESGSRDDLFPVRAATESVRRRGWSTSNSAPATGWSTTSSREAMSGTAPRPCRSSTAGSDFPGPDAGCPFGPSSRT